MRGGSFDDLVGAGEQQGRNGQAERFGRFEIDNQLELGRLLDRQIGGLLAFQNPSGVNAELTKNNSQARSIADQAAGSSELAPLVDCWNGIASRQCHELLAPAAEERVRGDDERTGV